MTKATLRNSIRNKLDSIPSLTKQKNSAAITEKIMVDNLWKSAESIFIFISMLSREPSTAALIEAALMAGKITAVPRIEPKTGVMTFKKINGLSYPNEVLTEKHPFGFYQPGAHLTDVYPEISQVNLILVPGVAFSPDCKRLGNGGGYYDHFLSTVPPNTTSIGICFQHQIVSEIPVEKHDMRVMEVCTEKNWYRCPDFTQFLHS